MMSPAGAYCLAAIAAALLAGCAPAADPVQTDPAELVAVIAEAAREKDYRTLSEHMAEKFSYSFGRDPSRADALSRYRTQPEMLDKMADVLGKECAWNRSGPETYFVCPAAAADEEKSYYGWRAGLRRKDDGSWEFVWFIAGD